MVSSDSVESPIAPSSSHGSFLSSNPFEMGLPNPENDNDPKRRRVGRACDQCRRKKVKCDGAYPCNHCSKNPDGCIYSPPKKRSTGKGLKYISNLENRLERMESLLQNYMPEYDLDDIQDDTESPEAENSRSITGKSSGSMQSKSPSITPAPDDHNADNPPANITSLLNTSVVVGNNTTTPADLIGGRRESATDSLAEDIGLLHISADGMDGKFSGPSSSWSFFNRLKNVLVTREPKGVEANNMELFSHVVATGYISIPEIMEKSRNTPLPPRHIADQYVKAYFAHFHTILPIFHRPSFFNLYEQQHSSSPPKDVSWIGAYNMVLAFGKSLEKVRTAPGEWENNAGIEYFVNAWNLSDYLFSHTNTLMLQALTLMSLWLLSGQYSPTTRWVLLGATVRAAQHLGLHRSSSAWNMSPIQKEERKRVFWALYIVDRYNSLAWGRPPAIHDLDCDVELPEDVDDQKITQNNILTSSAFEERPFNFFIALIKYARICGKVYDKLYSAQSSHQSPESLVANINELDAILSEWKDNIPNAFRPDSPLKEEQFSPHIFSAIGILHVHYYSLLLLTHRPLFQLEMEGKIGLMDLVGRTAQSSSIVVTAARTGIDSFQIFKKSVWWSTPWLSSCMSMFQSMVLIFLNILNSPLAPSVDEDVDKLVLFMKTVNEMPADAFPCGISDFMNKFVITAQNVVQQKRALYSRGSKRNNDVEKTPQDSSSEFNTSSLAMFGGGFGGLDNGIANQWGSEGSSSQQSPPELYNDANGQFLIPQEIFSIPGLTTNNQGAAEWTDWSNWLESYSALLVNEANKSP